MMNKMISIGTLALKMSQILQKHKHMATSFIFVNGAAMIGLSSQILDAGMERQYQEGYELCA